MLNSDFENYFNILNKLADERKIVELVNSIEMQLVEIGKYYSI